MAEPLVKTKSKDHRKRKAPGARDFFDKQRAERNASRPKQRWVPSSAAKLSMAEFENLTDEEVLAIVPGHWERP